MVLAFEEHVQEHGCIVGGGQRQETCPLLDLTKQLIHIQRKGSWALDGAARRDECHQLCSLGALLTGEASPTEFSSFIHLSDEQPAG
jgi:hypothetical protein